MEDRKLAPGLSRPTFERISQMIEDILSKDTLDPRESALLRHGVVLIDWYLDGSDRVTEAFKLSEEVLRAMHFSEEEIIAINVFFRKRRDTLETFRARIEDKLSRGIVHDSKKEGVKINVRR